MIRERQRLEQDRDRSAHWRRWGTYLSERQWGTVREDYSADGEAWAAFPFEHSHLRAYRWGEDGLLGFCDNHGRLCLAPALWNEHDPILKERLFGLTGSEGNHGEDVKELYWYEDALPSHAYNRATYTYPQAAFPYAQLRAENAKRGFDQDEYELVDTGVLDGDRVFELTVEYAKAAADDILVRYTVVNRGPEAAPVHLLPQLWFRNTWSYDPGSVRPQIALRSASASHVVLTVQHPELGTMALYASTPDAVLFTENDTNAQALYGVPNATPYVKDAFHRAHRASGDGR